MGITTIYTDGSTILKNPSPVGVTFAWVAVESVFTLERVNIEKGGFDSQAKFIKSGSGFVPKDLLNPTNNNAEFLAIVEALEAMEFNWSGLVVSDSLISLGRIFEGWRTKGLDSELLKRKDDVIKNLGRLSYMHVDGHPTVKQLELGIGKRGNPVSKWNKMCDSICTVENGKILAKENI